VPIAALGELTAATALWRFGGTLMVTVIAKAKLALTPEAEMLLIAADPIQPGDDTAPQLRAVDVTMTGHAYPANAGDTQSTVRLMIATHQETLLDKLAFVRGDRDAATGNLKPFQRVSLGYDRAYGGIGFADNPLGTGYGSCADKTPNLIDPRRADKVASFAPIPASFPARKRLLGSTPKSTLTGSVAEIPDGFDWSYFQAAPADQRIAALRGGEWIAIEGAFEHEPRIRTRLPQLRALGKIYPMTAEPMLLPDSVPLVIDTLHVDCDARACHVVWRGSFPVFDPRTVQSLAVAVALESDADPTLWPELADLELSAVATAGLGGERGGDFERTVALDRLPPPSPHEGTVQMSPDQAARKGKLVAPFAIATSSTKHAPSNIPGAPWALDPAQRPQSPHAGEGTVAVVDAGSPSDPGMPVPIPHHSMDHTMAPTEDAPGAELGELQSTAPLAAGASSRASPWASGVAAGASIAPPLPDFLHERPAAVAAGPPIGAVVLRPGLGSELLLALTEDRRRSRDG
jgi:hypothetical protein